VWREILEDLAVKTDVPEPAGAPIPPGLTVPSVTQYSRTSLLSGRLTSGAAADEKRAFEAHPALVRVSKTQPSPVLFHKGELSQPEAVVHWPKQFAQKLRLRTVESLRRL
jgi:hypothetical protein